MAQFKILSRDSAVGIATLYGLDGPGIESRQPWGLPNYHCIMGIEYIFGE
jgi:hypothetical protein